MNPSSTPTSLPGGPLGRYLLHPGQETSNVVHHVVRVLEAVGTVAVPVLLGAFVAIVVGRLVLVALRRATSGAGTGHVVVVSPGPEVDPSGAEALWNGLHGVLRRRGWRGAVSGRPHVAFEVGSSAGRLCFGLWVPAGVPAPRVARVAEAAWPGAVTEVVPATAPLPGGEGIAAGELHLAEPEWFSLRADQPTDPYRLLMATLGDLGSGDGGVVQVLARPAGTWRRRRCRRAAIALRSGRPRSKLVRFIDFWMTKGVPQHPNLSADPDARRRHTGGNREGGGDLLRGDRPLRRRRPSPGPRCTPGAQGRGTWRRRRFRDVRRAQPPHPPSPRTSLPRPVRPAARAR